mmetsp:Transcript_11694/g.20768  ORF Transcript_11694/g.20768 Transcript_11694/m.20768 type:complete len:100 (+) Transcript_11694:1222-1521(+)
MCACVFGRRKGYADCREIGSLGLRVTSLRSLSILTCVVLGISTCTLVVLPLGFLALVESMNIDDRGRKALAFVVFLKQVLWPCMLFVDVRLCHKQRQQL